MEKLTRAALPRLALLGLALLLVQGACSESTFTIDGTGRLPACSDPAGFDFDGTRWWDSGIVTVDSAGCEGGDVGSEIASCPLDWELSQSGNDLDILVDTEYAIKGRMCGDQLFLRGGWWLPSRSRRRWNRSRPSRRARR